MAAGTGAAPASPRMVYSQTADHGEREGGGNSPAAVLVRDLQGCIPLSLVLSEGDPLFLLTPVVVPFDWDGKTRTTTPSAGREDSAPAAALGSSPQQPPVPAPAPAPTQDPFEPLGRALGRQPLKPKVHHVPYTARGGISTTHVELIRKTGAKLVIFVISGPPSYGQTSQVDIAGALQDVGGNLPQVILACCNVRELGRLATSFPTIIQIPDYSRQAFDSAVALLFRGVGQQQLRHHSPYQQPQQQSQPQQPHQHVQHQNSISPPLESPQQARGPANVQNLMVAPRLWKVDEFAVERDMDAVYQLWCQTVSDQFSLSRFKLQMLLSRPGYAMHYVVREPETGETVGFCATYTTYINSDQEQLVGSIAALIVRPEYRRRGIGLSLHNSASNWLKRTRGLSRLQLGSTFPRLLFGLPVGISSEDWFRRRGWTLDGQGPGQGQEVCDWLLRFGEYPEHEIAPQSIVFRPCSAAEADAVLDLVSRESTRYESMGWYDQYLDICRNQYVGAIIIGLVGNSIVASALTYIPGSESSAARDMPWTGTLSGAIGGVTCICIADDIPGINITRDAIMIRLLDACVKNLKEQNMHGMFLDAVKGGDEGFQVMGFQKWARYRDCWRPA